MKVAVRLTLLLALLMTACSGTPPDTPEAPTQAVVNTRVPTLEPTTAPTRQPTVTQASVLKQTVNFRGIEFSYDLSLASEIVGDSLPASLSSQTGVQDPAHIRFTFDDAELSNVFNPREPQLRIYSVQDYRQSSEQTAGARIDLLSSLIDEKPELVGYELPVLPVVDAKQLFHIQLKYLDFEDGSGLRYISRYGGEDTAVTNQDIFYTYQGLSDDGKYIICFYFPLTTSVLPDSLETVPEEHKDFLNLGTFETYLQDTVGQLGNLSPQSFNPNINLLDELVQSISLPELTGDMVLTSDPARLQQQIQQRGFPALQEFWDKVGVRSPELFKDGGALEGNLFDLTINGGRKEYSLLIVSDEDQLDWQYLVFHSLGNQWLFLGNIDLPGQEYLPPNYRVVQSPDRSWSWLVIDWLKTSAQDAVQYEQAWYLISDPVIQPVLTLPVEGYSMSPEIQHNVHFQSSEEIIEQVVPQSVQLSYTISYSIFGDGIGRTKTNEIYDLFQSQHSAMYTWDEDQMTFVLNPDASSLTDEQIRSGFGFENDGEGFLAFGGELFTQLAESGTDLQRRWMKSFLGSLQQSDERDRLMSLLGG
jgi:hypothetical protein